MARIQLYESSIIGIHGATKSRRGPSKKYKAIIAKTDKKISEDHRRAAVVYEKASKFLAR